ncbi:MAG: hypothetical protein ACRC8F_09080 [Cetobacterium sp.]
MIHSNTTNNITNNLNSFPKVLKINEKKIRTEYLFLLNKKEGRFSDKKSIENLFKINTNVEFVGDNLIRYKNLNINYSLENEELATTEEQIYVHLVFSIQILKEESDKELDEYSNFLREIREIISKWDDYNEILWDGIGYFYAVQAYPMVYEIENLTRKLITKFMLKNIGREWINKYISPDIKKTVKGVADQKSANANFLYNIDFKQLENFLFAKFSTEDRGKLYELIRKGEGKVEDLQKFLPESNWNRLFSTLMEDTKEKDLQENLGKLYELRCKVAHNNIITKQDFEQIKRYHQFLKEKFEIAITKIGKIDKEEAKTIANSFGKFIPENEKKEVMSKIQKRLNGYLVGCNYQIVDSEENKKIVFDIGLLQNTKEDTYLFISKDEHLHVLIGNLIRPDINLIIEIEILENIKTEELNVIKVSVLK